MRSNLKSAGKQELHFGTLHNQKNNLGNLLLVGGFNPFEKYARQIGSFPQVGV